jgi:hypothetical protein
VRLSQQIDSRALSHQRLAMDAAIEVDRLSRSSVTEDDLGQGEDNRVIWVCASAAVRRPARRLAMSRPADNLPTSGGSWW